MYNPNKMQLNLKALPVHDTMVRDIPLDAALLSAFVRRGRRRLNELEGSTKTMVKLDRVNGSLKVVGSPANIQKVEEQLECMTGPRKEISCAAWAELMRTRTEQEDGVALQRIQSQSGCRVHIERGRSEVRLFGRKGTVAVADRLLDDFQQMCVERVVKIDKMAGLNMEMLTELAQVLRVTFRLEGDNIFVLGLEAVVEAAAEELTRYFENPSQYTLRPSAVAAEKMSAAVASLCNLDSSPTTASGEVYESGSELGTDWSPTQASETINPMPGFQNSPQNSPQSLAQSLASCSYSPLVSPMGMQGVQQMLPMQSPEWHVCHTCGASRFCGRCGQHMWTVQQGYPIMSTPGAPAAPAVMAQMMQKPMMTTEPNFFPPFPQQGMMAQGVVPMGR